jgi:hypothetical protein
LTALAGVVLALAAAVSPPSAGERVRVTRSAPAGAPLVGTLVGLDAEAVVVKPFPDAAPVRIAVSEVERFEVSRGRRPQPLQGALIGAAIGTMPGLALTFGDYSSDVHGSGPDPLAVAAVGAAAGAALGAVVGWALKSEEWSPLPLASASASVCPAPGGGVAFSLRVAWGKRPISVR